MAFFSKSSLDFYDDLTCNQLNGTDGTTMGSFISKEDTIYLFNGDACKWEILGKYDYWNCDDVKSIWNFRPRDIFNSSQQLLITRATIRTLFVYHCVSQFLWIQCWNQLWLETNDFFIMRSIHVKFKEESSVRGIPTYRFVFPQTLFASPDKNPDNKCFCTTPDNYELCDGIFDVGRCQKGAPLAFSFPHLMHCSQTIKDSVIGMNPDVEKHESFFDIEPVIDNIHGWIKTWVEHFMTTAALHFQEAHNRHLIAGAAVPEWLRVPNILWFRCT